MIILDTNVVSELMKDGCDPNVLQWNNSVSPDDLYLTSIAVAEIMLGIALLPIGKKRDQLSLQAERFFQVISTDRILNFDYDAALIYAKLWARNKKQGRNIADLDVQIAAIATFHDAALATRNINDFDDGGLDLIDPWSV